MPRLLLLFSLIFPLAAKAQPNHNLDSLRIVVTTMQDSTSTGRQQLPALQAFLAAAKKAHRKTDVILAYQQLAAVNYRLGNINEALHYYKLYALELEHLNNVELYRQHQFEKSLYENELRALREKMALSEQENSELKSWKKEHQRINRWISIGLQVITVIFLLLFIPWLYLRLKRKGKQPPEPAKEEENGPDKLTEVLTTTRNQLIKAETELDLADILAGRMVPLPEKVMANNFSLRQKFLLHQPKKLTSGNGLYMAAVQDKTLIAVYDTPGHGATGGLLCGHIYRVLDDQVRNRQILSPALLLNQLAFSLQELFPAGPPFAEGIGISICLVDEKARKITYSGAAMSLFMIYKGELHKTAGTITGLLPANKPATFENTELATTKGMCFYLSTDGFYQQTGGAQQKPFGEEAFGKALEQVAHQPLPEQQQVLTKIFTDWKGGNDQDDDVLVLGFRVA